MTARTYPLTDILVVGGCGFLGHHIVNLLLQQHPESRISVLDLHTNHNRFPNVTYYDGDITDSEQVRDTYRKSRPQVIINTVSPITQLKNADEIYFKVNVEGTRTLCDVAAEENIKAFVYTSSAGVVTDDKAQLINVNETVPLPKAYASSYEESKAKGEAVVIATNGKNGLLTCALRVAGLFGPGDRQVIPGMLSVLRNKQTRMQLGENDNLFDFTYIENAAYAHILAAERLIHPDPNQPPVAGEVFFITNGEPVYFWDMPRAIWALYNGHVDPSYIKLPKGLSHYLAFAAEMWAALMKKEPGFTRFRVKYACNHRYFDIRKARSALDYTTLYSLHDGLVKTLNWFKAEEAKAGEKKEN